MVSSLDSLRSLYKNQWKMQRISSIMRDRASVNLIERQEGTEYGNEKKRRQIQKQKAGRQKTGR